MSIQIGDIQLDGVALNNSLQWVDRYSQTLIASTSKRTLGGNLVVFSQNLNAGQKITLTATVDTGWLSYGMVTAMIARAAVAGAVYVLNFHGENHNVRFDHEGTPVDFTPLVPKNIGYDNDNDYFIGTMSLFTV